MPNHIGNLLYLKNIKSEYIFITYIKHDDLICQSKYYLNKLPKNSEFKE